jgi:hypothetical protein
MKICPKFWGTNLSKKFSAQIKIRKIDSWLPNTNRSQCLLAKKVITPKRRVFILEIFAMFCRVLWMGAFILDCSRYLIWNFLTQKLKHTKTGSRTCAKYTCIQVLFKKLLLPYSWRDSISRTFAPISSAVQTITLKPMFDVVPNIQAVLNFFVPSNFTYP